MALGSKAESIHTQISNPDTKLGDLRKIAKEIKKDHDLAIELWSTGHFNSRQLAILIMDKKELTQERIDEFLNDIQNHDEEDRLHLADWFMANQLMKDKKIITLIESWEHHAHPLQRRIYWYYQARLRWTGQTPPDNTDELLASIEENMAKEEPEVQWAMNFTAGQIGTYDADRRSRCIAIGETIGLYKDEIVAKNCTPNYLPEFIRIQAAKVNA